MGTDYNIGDYLDVNRIATKITEVKDGMYYHYGIQLSAHGNIVLKDKVFEACGFKKVDNEWQLGIKENCIIHCKKDTSGTYSVCVIPLRTICNQIQKSDLIILPVLQEIIRDNCQVELPINEQALTEAISMD